MLRLTLPSLTEVVPTGDVDFDNRQKKRQAPFFLLRFFSSSLLITHAVSKKSLLVSKRIKPAACNATRQNKPSPRAEATPDRQTENLQPLQAGDKHKQRSANVPTAAKSATSRQTKSPSSISAVIAVFLLPKKLVLPLWIPLNEFNPLTITSVKPCGGRRFQLGHDCPKSLETGFVDPFTTSIRGLFSPWHIFHFQSFRAFTDTKCTSDSARCSTAQSSRKTASTMRRSWVRRPRRSNFISMLSGRF